MKIVFPTDFSESANKAFAYALKIADNLGAEIITVHAYELPRVSPRHMPNTLADIYDSIQLEKFEDYRDEVPALRKIADDLNLSRVRVSNVMQEGSPISTIVRVAKNEKADLIIMGTKGATGLREIFLGSVTGEVMEKATCPVLGVPEKAVIENGSKIIAVTTDFKEEDTLALQQVMNLASKLGAEVHCIHFDILGSETILHRLNSWKKTLDFDVGNIHFEVISTASLEQGMIKYIEDKKVSITAMLTHKRGFFEELFNYSLAKKMSYHLKTPVLAIPAGIFKK